MSDLPSRLRADLTAAMRTRDRDRIAALRSALAALANAEAVPVDTMPRAGAVETSAVGAGAADAPRRELDEVHQRAILRGELDEHLAAADSVDPHDPARAAQLRALADALRPYL